MALTTTLKYLFKEKGIEMDFLEAEEYLKQDTKAYKTLPVDEYLKAFNDTTVPFMAIGYERMFESGLYLVGYLDQNTSYEVALEMHKIYTPSPEGDDPILKLVVRKESEGIEQNQITEKKYLLPKAHTGSLIAYDGELRIQSEDPFIMDYLTEISQYFNNQKVLVPK